MTLADEYVTLDLDALIERETRRRVALDQATSAQAHTARGWAGKRADAASSNDRPELIWPDQRYRLPGRCWNCGATPASFETDPPYGTVRRGETTCLLCSRVVVRWKSVAPRPVVLAPEASLAPKRGRPPGTATVPADDRPRCAVCRRRAARPGRSNCRACIVGLRTDRRQIEARLLELLAERGPITREALCAELGIDEQVLKTTLGAARYHGHAIRHRHGRGYVLVATAEVSS